MSMKPAFRNVNKTHKNASLTYTLNFRTKNLSVTFFVMNEKNLARDKMGKPNNF